MATESTSSKPGRTVWFWVAVAAAVLLLAFLLHSDIFTSLVKRATDWAQGVMTDHPVRGAAIFYLMSAVSAMLAFASSAVLVPPANEAWGKPVTFLLLWGGWLGGSIAAYGIGRLARPLLARLGYRQKLKDYQEFVSKRMKFWAVLLFCVAVPSEIPGYLFGGVQYPFWKFLVAMGASEAIYALGVIIAGESLLEAKPGTLLVTAGILIVVAVAAGVLSFRGRKKRKAG